MKLVTFLFLLLLAVGAVLYSRRHAQPPSRLPQPIEYLEQVRKHQLDDADKRLEYKQWRKQHKQGRREWIESMHRAAPGTDWKVLDASSRRELAEAKRRLRRGIGPTGSDTGGGRESRELAGEWIEKGSNNLAGRMHVADVDPDGRIWAGSSGGNIWTVASGSSAWECRNDWLRFNDIQMVKRLDHEGGRRTLALTSWPVTLQRSDDDGFSWDEASGLEDIAAWGWALRGIVTTGPDPVVYVLGVEWNHQEWTHRTSLYRSLDQGESFARIQSWHHDGALADLWTPAVNGDAVYLAINDALHLVNADGSLTALGGLTPGLETEGIEEIQLCGSATDFGTWIHALAVHGPSGDSYVFRSTDDGQSFTYQGAIDVHPFMRNSFNCSITSPGNLFLGGVNTWRSLNSGVDWTVVNEWWEYYDFPATKLHADTPGIQPFLDTDWNEYLLISTDGGLYRSDDHLASVQNISLEGLRISQYYTSYTHREQTGVVFAGSQDQGFQRALQDPGGLIDFTQTISGDYGHIVSGNGGSSVWTVYPGFAMYYPDAVGSTSARFWDFVGSNYFWMPPLMADPANPTQCWLGGGGTSGGAHLWRLNGSGTSITATELPFDFSGGGSARISALAASPVSPAKRYVLTSEGDFYWSLDGGLGWSQSSAFSGPEPHYFYGACVLPSPVEADRVYIAGSGYSNPAVYHSEDHGVSFTPLIDGLPGTLVYDLAVSPDDSLLFAATEVGPFVWERRTGQWTELAGLDGPDQTYWEVDFVPAIATARFCTYGRGIWDFRLQQAPAAVTGLVISMHGPVAVLNWAASPHADSYRVEACADPHFRDEVTQLAITTATTASDHGALSFLRRYYRVTAIN